MAVLLSGPFPPVWIGRKFNLFSVPAISRVYCISRFYIYPPFLWTSYRFRDDNKCSNEQVGGGTARKRRPVSGFSISRARVHGGRWRRWWEEMTDCRRSRETVYRNEITVRRARSSDTLIGPNVSRNTNAERLSSGTSDKGKLAENI